MATTAPFVSMKKRIKLILWDGSDGCRHKRQIIELSTRPLVLCLRGDVSVNGYSRACEVEEGCTAIGKRRPPVRRGGNH